MVPHAASGTVPFLPAPKYDYGSLLLGAALGLAYVAASVSLISFNKMLMNETVFPYSVALTMAHMVGGFRYCPAFLT